MLIQFICLYLPAKLISRFFFEQRPLFVCLHFTVGFSIQILQPLNLHSSSQVACIALYLNPEKKTNICSTCFFLFLLISLLLRSPNSRDFKIQKLEKLQILRNSINLIVLSSPTQFSETRGLKPTISSACITSVP